MFDSISTFTYAYMAYKSISVFTTVSRSIQFASMLFPSSSKKRSSSPWGMRSHSYKEMQVICISEDKKLLDCEAYIVDNIK